MTIEVEKPAELDGYIRAARPYGRGNFTRVGIQIFAAALWTDAASWSMDDVFALSIRYARSFSADSLAEKSVADMHRLEKLDPGLRKAWAAALEAVFRDVRRGDAITALWVPGQGASFFCNGAPTGIIEAELARRFLDIWFSPRTTAPELRAALLHSA